jgi:hypothetical protein
VFMHVCRATNKNIDFRPPYFKQVKQSSRDLFQIP